MKATRQEPKKPFVPVTLVLETQKEVNLIFTCLRHSPLTDYFGVNIDKIDYDQAENFVPSYDDVYTKFANWFES